MQESTCGKTVEKMVKKMSFDVFMSEANEYAFDNRMTQRYGQAVYNYLTKVNPTLAQEVPSDVDCFYDNQKCGEFFEFVKENWAE